MSVLQEYEAIRRRLGKEKYSHIEAFLKLNPQYFLSDIYYRKTVWNEFSEWENQTYKTEI